MLSVNELPYLYMYVRVQVCVSCRDAHVSWSALCMQWADHGAEEVATSAATQWTRMSLPHEIILALGYTATVDTSNSSRGHFAMATKGSETPANRELPLIGVKLYIPRGVPRDCVYNSHPANKTSVCERDYPGCARPDR